MGSSVLLALVFVFLHLNGTQAIQQWTVSWKLGSKLHVVHGHYYSVYVSNNNIPRYLTCLTCKGDTYFAGFCTPTNQTSLCPPCPAGSYQPQEHHHSHLNDSCVCEGHAFWDELRKTCATCTDCPRGSHLAKPCSTNNRQFICCLDEYKIASKNKACKTYTGSTNQLPEISPFPGSSESQDHDEPQQEDWDETAKKPGHDVAPNPTGRYEYDVLPNPHKPRDEQFPDPPDSSQVVHTDPPISEIDAELDIKTTASNNSVIYWLCGTIPPVVLILVVAAIIYKCRNQLCNRINRGFRLIRQLPQ